MYRKIDKQKQNTSPVSRKESKAAAYSKVRKRNAKQQNLDSFQSLQRLIAIGDDIPKLGRYVAVQNTLNRFPDQDIVQITNSNLGDMGSNEPLFILAHGSTTSVGGRSPTEMAQLLIEKGLKTGTVIEVRACNSATDDHINGRYTENLVKEIYRLSDNKIRVSATGYTGTGVILEDGRYGAKDQGLNKGLKKEAYSGVLSKYDKDIKLIEKKIVEYRLQGYSDAQIANWATKVSKHIFKELYEANALVLKSEYDDRMTTRPVEESMERIRAILKI